MIDWWLLFGVSVFAKGVSQTCPASVSSENFRSMQDRMTKILDNHLFEFFLGIHENVGTGVFTKYVCLEMVSRKCLLLLVCAKGLSIFFQFFCLIVSKNFVEEPFGVLQSLGFPRKRRGLPENFQNSLEFD